MRLTPSLNLGLNIAMKEARPVVEAVERAGGISALARALNVTPQAVWKWVYEQGRVPPARVLEVERVTGVPRDRLRPDIFVEPEGAA